MKNEKKKFVQKIELGYCPNNIVRIVLQGSNCIGKCIAIHWFVLQRKWLSCIAGLYCRRPGCREIVSQYKKNCIVTRQGTWAVLYCNTATAAGGAGVGRWGAGQALGARLGAQGARGVCRRACVGAQAGVQARGALARGARAHGARARRALGRASGNTALQAATRPDLAETHPGQGPRYGHCAPLGAPVHAWVCSAGPGWVFCAPSFSPGLTRYFPESLNEHCSL